MCTYQCMEYSCGHRRTIVAEWCDRYINKLQSHIRRRPEIPYYTKNDQICCSNPAPSTSSPLTRGKDNPAGYRQQPPACAVEPTLVGNFVSMATNDRQLRCLDTGPSR
ncbi:hypothetical protein MGG_11004 [Pyricularia oryzae 70-15]|uniref:Uncharacterized protein n=1 Tax=Pyricularia oryzae (strain 70-15 / ATCC MYA-4617 / FGSC 8958) TaxID=242507 RepID=G4NBJ9_PYRO7|nr:uncharacterized protein MGG_11004 [Pyricularia oryzae 70-15]EHA48104.1 hypothetical protein MGG_11004 [Pyricularia oryzae 70-15]